MNFTNFTVLKEKILLPPESVIIGIFTGGCTGLAAKYLMAHIYHNPMM